MTDVFNSETPVSHTDLVGDGKKFKDVDALAKGKIEADAHIARLEAEQAGLRAELDKRMKAEEQLETLKNELKQRQGGSEQPKGNTTPALTASDIDAIVEQKITSRERNRTATQNIEEANQTAIRHFGSPEAAANAVKAAAAKRKVSVQRLKEIAAESPSFFAEIVGVPAQTQTQTAGSFVQPDAGIPDKEHVSAQQKPGTYEYAENVRRTDPRKYWSPQFQNKYVVEPRLAGTYKIPN